MGPKRPKKPNQHVINVISQGIDAVLDNGGFIVTSGKGNYGSVRHRYGDAVDGKFLDSKGNPIRIATPLMERLVLSCASFGISGFGAGEEYMGSYVVHMDVYPLSKYTSRMGRAWGSYGNRIESKFVAASRWTGGRGGLSGEDNENEFLEEDGKIGPSHGYDLYGSNGYDLYNGDQNQFQIERNENMLINPLKFGENPLNTKSPLGKAKITKRGYNPFLDNPFNKIRRQ